MGIEHAVKQGGARAVEANQNNGAGRAPAAPWTIVRQHAGGGFQQAGHQSRQQIALCAGEVGGTSLVCKLERSVGIFVSSQSIKGSSAFKQQAIGQVLFIDALYVRQRG